MHKIIKKGVDDLNYYQGENAIPGIKFRMAGVDLGVTSWGMNVLEIAPGCLDYPEHDHMKDGQEEVYVILRGSAIFRTGDQEVVLNEGDFVRVGPTIKRKIIPGTKGVTVLALGGTPGQAYSQVKS